MPNIGCVYNLLIWLRCAGLAHGCDQPIVPDPDNPSHARDFRPCSGFAGYVSLFIGSCYRLMKWLTRTAVMGRPGPYQRPERSSFSRPAFATSFRFQSYFIGGSQGRGRTRLLDIIFGVA